MAPCAYQVPRVPGLVVNIISWSLGNLVPLVLLFASPVLSLGGGLVPKTSCMPGNLFPLVLLFESDIVKTKGI